MAHRLVHFAAVAKADLDLGRVHVDVDPRRIDLDIQRIDRLTVAVQHVLVGTASRMREHLVAHVAAIDVGELVIGAGPGQIRHTNPAGHPDRPGAVVDCNALIEQVAAQHVGQPLVARRGAPLLDQPAVMPDRKTDIRPGQRMPPHGFDAVRQFGGVGLEEFAPRRRAEEQLLDFHGGSDSACSRAQFAAAAVQGERAGLTGAAGQHGELRHRADRRQRLPAKAHGDHRLQVQQRRDLAGGMAAQRHRQLGAGNATAVILHRDQPHAAREQPHRDLGRAGIEGVVSQFADHRRGPFDHFASGDLAHQFIGQFADRPAGDRGEDGTHGRGLTDSRGCVASRSCGWVGGFGSRTDNQRPWNSSHFSSASSCTSTPTWKLSCAITAPGSTRCCS